MSDNSLTIRVKIGNDEFDATPEALNELKTRGISYTTGPDRAPGDGNANGRGWSWAEAARTLGDTARGAAHGVTLGLVDSKFGTDKSIPERLGLAPYSEVQERSPIASTVGDIGGSLVLPGGVLGKGAGLLARAGEQALVGGLEGGIREAAEGGDFAKGAYTGAMTGGIGGAALGAAAALGGEGSKAIRNVMSNSADTLRTKALGIGAQEMKGLAQRFGVDELPKSLAAHIEATVPSSGTGRSVASYAEELNRRADDVGPKIDQLLEKADAEEGVKALIPQSWGEMLARLEGRAGKLENPGHVLPQQVSEANAMRGSLDKLKQAPAPNTSPELRKLKSSWQREAYVGPGGSVPDTKNAAVAEAFGQEGRQALEDVMGYALPETKQAFNDLNREYEGLALLRDIASKRAATEAADSKIPGLVGAVGGGAIGGVMNDEDPLEGMAFGALMGVGTGTRNFATQALSQTRAMDALANAARYGSRKLTLPEMKLLKTLQARAGTFGGLAGSYGNE